MKNDQEIFIPLPLHFNFDECLWFLNRNYDDILYSIKNNEIRRAFTMHAQDFLIGISQQENFLVVTILLGEPTQVNKDIITAYVSNWFDLGSDLTQFYKLLSKHKQLQYMLNEFNGLRLMGINDVYEALCWSIIGQQINLTFAYSLKRRLVEKYGRAINYENELYYLFPTPQVLSMVDSVDLRSMQFSQKKAEYIIGVAHAYERNELSTELLLSQPTLQARQKLLTGIRGIGIWTANYTLMKSIREPSCIPYGDVGLLKALVNHNIIEQRNDALSIKKFFNKFKGWESYLVFYLWRSLSKRPV